MQKYPYETPGSPPGNRRPRRFTGLLIVHIPAAGQARTAPSAGARDPGPWGDPGPSREVTIAVSVTIACDEAR